MAQYTDFLQQIEKFVNRTRLNITCEKSGDMHLVEPSFMAGWLVGWQADETWVKLDILKAYCRLKYSIFRFV